MLVAVTIGVPFAGPVLSFHHRAKAPWVQGNLLTATLLSAEQVRGRLGPEAEDIFINLDEFGYQMLGDCEAHVETSNAAGLNRRDHHLPCPDRCRTLIGIDHQRSTIRIGPGHRSRYARRTG
jgi:hypothetical protein